MSEQRRLLPALAHAPLTAIYDPVVRLTTRESVFKTELLRQADLQPGERVLDLGCGTATLAVAAKRAQPGANIVGLDGDPRILSQARAKAALAGVELQLDEAMSDRMPYQDASFDCVLSSLFFHHLDRTGKYATLRDIQRVLKPGGRLLVADWGKAASPLMRIAFLLVQLLDGFESTRDNVEGLLPVLIRDSGFVDIRETGSFSTPLGTLAIYGATRI